MAGESYTGKKRRKETPWSVKFGDALVSRIIAVGGIGTIVAILLVVLVLVATAFPLLKRAKTQSWQSVSTSDALHFGVDTEGLLVWGISSDGVIEVRDTLNSQLVASYPLALDDGATLTCSSLSEDRIHLAIGCSNGTFRLAKVGFESELLPITAVPDDVEVSKTNPIALAEKSLYQWFDASGIRRIWLPDIEWSTPYKLSDEPVLAIDYLADGSSNRLSRTTTAHAAAICGDKLVFAKINGKKSMMGKFTETLTTDSCSITSRSIGGAPLNIAMLNNVQQAVVTWPNGTIDRYSLDNSKPTYVESQNAVDGGEELADATPLLGRQTIVCGTNDGRLLGWTIIRPEEESGIEAASDTYSLVLAHEVKIGDSPITAVASSQRNHVAIASDETNTITTAYVTTNSLLGSTSVPNLPANSTVNLVGFNADDNIMVAIAGKTTAMAELDMGHPEASWSGYFGRVWYEGHNHPKYIWQSSSGTEESEIKLSLMPLVFGTMKATFYAMLISIPLAILAAIYTSEFLSSSMRTRIKPIVELMASLPSVVLGYVAALVVAPYLQEHLMAILACIVIVPASFILAGNLWNLLPVDLLVRLQAFRLPLMFVCLPAAIVSAFALAGPIESLLFEGSIVQWLSGTDGSAVGGWMLLLVPITCLAVVMVVIGPLAEWTRELAIKKTPKSYALLSLLRFGIIALVVVGSAWGIAAILSNMGLDLRGSLFTNYQDKNALLVGAALGFCVIPIIYTISDDALQAVPQQLRSASLGCGATPWQTTIRVVVPSAMSGLFSAIMIGLGRAVGETMVVLCAAGNTPLMEWNPFNGFKTLSAALATELPEAAKGSTHFRTLFLAALLLFVLTLIANTLAEFVRIRFRKRASQL